MKKQNKTLLGGFKSIELLTKLINVYKPQIDSGKASLEEAKTVINAIGKSEKIIENQTQVAKIQGRKLDKSLYDYIFEPVE